MHNQRLENNVRQDIAELKKDLSTLKGDRAARFGKFEANVSNAAEDLTTWVEDGVSHFGEEFEKLTNDTKETVVRSAAGVKKDVGHGLSQYNAKAQEFADKVPGDFSKKAARYPWVSITIALVVGFLLGNLLKSARQPLG